MYPQIVQKDDEHSDYGSDFTPEEEGLLSELLTKVEANHVSTRPPPAAAPVVVPTPRPLVISDIEDYAVLPTLNGVSAPKAPLPRKKELPTSQVTGTTSGSKTVEHPNSTEGRQRELERQEDRERAWAADAAAASTPQAPQASQALRRTPAQQAMTRSPLDQFRKPPNKSFSVSDLIAPAWCELQYWYTLTKLGRKRRTPAMKHGTAVHKVLESEIYETVPVEITTREDGWALRIWNVIEGLRMLREGGMTRELEVWGLIDGQIVTGVIDELSIECPDRELEASAEEFYKNAKDADHYQMPITEYLLSPSGGGGKRLEDLAQEGRDEDEASTADAVGPPPPPPMQRFYITDVKTRASRSMPTVSSSGFRPTLFQLQMYYHMLNRLTTSEDITIEILAKRYKLDPYRTFTKAFVVEVGNLNERYFDAMSSQESDSEDNRDTTGASSPNKATSSSRLPPSQCEEETTSILFAHNHLSSLWDLMKDQLRLTFLPPEAMPTDQPVASSIPAHSQPSLLEPYPTIVSPLLTAKYLYSPITPTVDNADNADNADNLPSTSTEPTFDALGSRSVLFSPAALTAYISDQMRWWRGQRSPRGVDTVDAWKCRSCDFRDECSWREEKGLRFSSEERRCSDGVEAATPIEAPAAAAATTA
ncbi:Exonuclease V - a 5' deoxyribonuclease domain containing protein [Elaphomyces granulatus]